MDELINIKSINVTCDQCGTINRIVLANAYNKISKCAKCGQQLTAPEQMQGEEESSPNGSNLGLLSSFLLASFALVAFRYAFDSIQDSDHRMAAIILLIAIVVSFNKLRAITISAALALLLISVVIFCTKNWSALKNQKITPYEGASQIWQIFSGYEPVKNFNKRISSSKYLKYVEAVDVRNEEINILASSLTVDCANNDKGCEAKAIAEYVSTQINYRSDPINGGDYIKPVHLTLKSGAGDCEDKAILASSLLGTIGINSHFVFEKNHVYLRACFQSPINRKYLDSKKFTKTLGQFCYDLEPTFKWTGLGVNKHDEDKIEAVYDVKTKTQLN